MLKSLFASALLTASACALAAPSSADNINEATDRAVSTYRAGGTDALIAEGKSCYAGLNTARANKAVNKDVEYCVAFDIASNLIATRTKSEPRAYLETSEMLTRATYYLEQAGVIRQPDQLAPYFQRFSNVQHRLPAL